MKIKSLLLVAAFSFTTAGLSFAGPKTYQVTGPVLALTDDTITVQNSAGEKWEIARDKGTKVTGDLKVGAKVTIQYTMTAASVENKDGGSAAKPADAKGKKGKK